MLGLTVEQRLLGTLAFGNVERGPQHCRPSLKLDNSRCKVHPTRLTVFGSNLDFVVRRRFLTALASQATFSYELLKVRINHVPEPHTEQLLTRVTGHRL